MLNGLSSRTFLDRVMQIQERCDVNDNSDNLGQCIQRQTGYESVCTVNTDGAKDSLCPAGNHVVSSLSDELRAVTKCHQVCAGSHHSWERTSGIHTKSQNHSHTRSVQTNTDTHQSAEDEVTNNSDHELHAAKTKLCTDGAEWADRKNFHQDYSSQDEETYEQRVTNFLPVELGYDIGHYERTNYGSDNHQNQCQDIHIYETEEQESLNTYRNGIAYVQGTRNQDIVYRLRQLKRSR